MAGVLTTRREVITSSLGLAGIIAAGRAPAAFVRSMVAARGVACGSKKTNGEVAWLMSDGNAIIDTGVKCGTGYDLSGYKAELRILGISKNGYICGSLNNKSPWNVSALQYSSGAFWMGGIGNASISRIVSENDDLNAIVDFNETNNKLTIDSNENIHDATFRMNLTCALFGVHLPSGFSAYSGVKIGRTSIWDINRNLVRSYIPFVVNNVPCMYDALNDKYYYNAASSGAFTAGPFV